MSFQQLILNLRLNEDATFSNYFPDNNLATVQLLEAFSRFEGEPFIFLWGAEGSGRTHLLQACCHAADPASAMYIDLAESGLQPEILTELEFFHLICLDNLDSLRLDNQWELALFHFFNRVRERESRLLISASQPPGLLAINLPDLQSRLNGGLTLHLQTLPDEQKVTVLQRRARARGFHLSETAATYLIHHSSRNMNDLIVALETLDHETLRSKRRLTVPFIKQVLRLI